MSHLYSSSPPRAPRDAEDEKGVEVAGTTGPSQRGLSMSQLSMDSDVEMMESAAHSRPLPPIDRNITPRPQRRREIEPRMPINNAAITDMVEAMADLASDASMVKGDTIWGTNVCLDDVRRRLHGFWRSPDQTDFFAALVSDLIDMEETTIDIDLRRVDSYDPELYRQTCLFPQEVLPCFDVTLAEAFDLEDNPNVRTQGLTCRLFNLNDVQSMRDMNPADIDTLVAVRGMVIRSTTLIPDMRSAFFCCTLCNHEIEVVIDNGRIEEPRKCANSRCQGSNSLELVHNRCKFTDKQLVKIQEAPEHIPDGDTPQTLDVYVYMDLVDSVRCGDRVEITGVYRASAVRRNPRLRTVDSVYKTYIDCVHINVLKGADELDEESSAAIADGATVINDDRNVNEKFERWAKEEGFIDRLVESLAPSIFEMEDVKRGLLCQLFGGTFGSNRHSNNNSGSGGTRSEINVLLCGDPGTSKSQLLSYVHRMAPRGIYTSGKGSSAVGLTAYITKDRDSGELILESGALVLSDLGICCIDEFDKMSESSRSILHEVMEQQTVSIAKAGIIATLNARTSILAAANPIESRYNPRKSVVENIDLPPTLMSRFDLIYLILDTPNADLDAKLAQHIVSMYYSKEDMIQREKEKNESRRQKRRSMMMIESEEESDESYIISQKELREYIKYARRSCHPKLRLDSEAATLLVDSYVEMRQLGRVGRSRSKVVSATPRQLESLIRLSQSLARMRLSSVVGEDDVSEAVRLHKVATLAAATDPTTGAIDLDRLNIGMSMEDERKLNMQCTQMLNVLRNLNHQTITAKSLLKQYNQLISHQNNNEENQYGYNSSIKMPQLKSICDRLAQAQKIRAGDWLRDNPVIHVLDTSDF